MIRPSLFLTLLFAVVVAGAVLVLAGIFLLGDGDRPPINEPTILKSGPDETMEQEGAEEAGAPGVEVLRSDVEALCDEEAQDDGPGSVVETVETSAQDVESVTDRIHVQLAAPIPARFGRPLLAFFEGDDGVRYILSVDAFGETSAELVESKPPIRDSNIFVEIVRTPPASMPDLIYLECLGPDLDKRNLPMSFDLETERFVPIPTEQVPIIFQGTRPAVWYYLERNGQRLRVQTTRLRSVSGKEALLDIPPEVAELWYARGGFGAPANRKSIRISAGRFSIPAEE